MYVSGAVYPFSPYFTDVKVAPVAGTYTLVVDPDDANTGTATITLADVPRDISGEIVAGGAPVSFTITTAGQNGRISFIGSAGQRIALTNTSTTIFSTTLTIQAPDGSQVAHANVINNNVVGPVYLPVSGAYSILVNPWDNYIGSMTVTMYYVDPDVYQAIPTDGTATTISQTIFQSAYLTFTGASGQPLSGSVTGSIGCGRYWYLVDPNNNSINGVNCVGMPLTPRNLGTTGTYTLQLVPNWTATGPVTVRVTLASLQISSLSPTSGSAGQIVTITGSRFGATQGTSTVMFNGVTATVSSWSDTSIVAAVPPTAATGPVVVTVGGQASNAVTFSVMAPPTISSLNPISGTIGQTVAIAGMNFGSSPGNSTVVFNGTAATVTAWSATSITTTVPSGATTGSVRVTVGGSASNGSMFTVLNDVTYHLHKEASDSTGVFRLRAIGPDSAATTAQTGNIGNSTGEILVKAFATDSGVPGVTGSLPPGSPINVTLYMRKTTTKGIMYPRVRARLNGDAGTLLCQATGATPLSSSVIAYTLSCTTGAVTVTSTDRIHLWVGVNVTTAPGGNTRGELSIEGINGSTDSLMTVRLPR
jgi:hypothetical protein